MPVRLFPREAVEKELSHRGCVKVKEYVFGSGALWRTRDSKFYFTVPHEFDGSTDENTLRGVLVMLDAR